MSISCRCPHCNHFYKLKDEHAGRQAKCKDCQKIFTVPSVAPAAHAEPERITEGGTEVYRHEAREEPIGPAEMTPWLSQIERHIERHIGPSPQVFHEIVSEAVHIDLHIVPPTHQPPSEQHPLGTGHYTIVTSGMSARPMTLPAGAAAEGISPYAELMIALPADWPGLSPDGEFDRDVMSDDRYWWPMRWLKTIARLPHEYGTFVTVGHTIPNGEDAEPYSDDTKQGCMLVMPPILCPGAMQLVVHDDVLINFYALAPIYPEEMNFKLKNGLEALFDRFQKAEVSELIRTDRENTCRKRFGIF